MAKKLKIVQFWGPSTVSGICTHIRLLRPVPRPPHALASRSVQMHLLVLGLNQRNRTETTQDAQNDLQDGKGLRNVHRDFLFLLFIRVIM